MTSVVSACGLVIEIMDATWTDVVVVFVYADALVVPVEEEYSREDAFLAYTRGTKTVIIQKTILREFNIRAVLKRTQQGSR